MSGERQRGLGRGLGALIPTDVPKESLVGRPSDMFFDRTAVTAPGSVGATRRRPRPSGAGATDSAGAGSAFDKAFDVLPGSRRAEQDESATAPAENEGSPVHEPATGSDKAAAPGAEGELQAVPGVRLVEIPLDDIRPNARQPRSVFDEDELSELAASIAEIGVLQPIVVREAPDGGTPYELIMGERRWRATREAGLDTVPAIVKSTSDDDMLRDALLENLHRAQLNPLEEAAAYQQLLDDFGCTHDELATRLSRSRPQISNTLRLLKLPPLVARRVAAGVLTAGHARALLGLPDAAAMERLAQRIVAEGLSVRSVEEIVAVATDDSVPATRRPRTRVQHPEFDALAAVLTDRLDTRVSINMGRNKGKLTVEFAGREDLERILAAIRDTQESDLDEGLRQAM